MSPQPEPQLIWVVGDDTNVGKTTVATALIRRLTAMNRKTLGYKPYAGARLTATLDLLEKAAQTDHYLAGIGARDLAAASPMTPPQYAELVNPTWRISHPSRDFTVLVRKGSDFIKRRYFYQTANSVAFTKRADFLRLNESIKLPIGEAKVIENRGADTVDWLDQDIQADSYNLLRDLGPEFVVCEGAGRLLPVWVGAPPVRHIFNVTNGNLVVFPNVNLDLTGRIANTMKFPPITFHINDDLKNAKRVWDVFPVLRRVEIDEQMELFVDKFLEACE